MRKVPSMNQLDQRACDRMWAIYSEWKDAAPPEVQAKLEALGPNGIQISSVVAEGRATICVSALTNDGNEQLLEIDGATIGFTVVGGEVVFSSDD